MRRLQCWRIRGDGELVAEAGVIGTWKKWRERRNECDGSEFKITLAMLGGGKLLHGARGSAYGWPAHAVLIGDDKAGVDGFCILKDFNEEIACDSGSSALSMAGPMEAANFCCSASAS